MTYAERELLKAVARAVAVIVRTTSTGGGYHADMIDQKLHRLEQQPETLKTTYEGEA